MNQEQYPEVAIEITKVLLMVNGMAGKSQKRKGAREIGLYELPKHIRNLHGRLMEK